MASFERDIKVIRDLQGGGNNFVKETIGYANLIFSILALHGGAELLKAFNEKQQDFEKTSKSDIKAVQKAHDGNLKTKGYLYPSFDSEPLKKAIRAYEQYGLNTGNRWQIWFGENKQVTDEERTLFSVYCQEVNLPGAEISTAENDLGFSRNEDISDLKYSDVTLTFALDDKIDIRRAITRILKKIKNPRTGRYGYKEDYQWDNILFLHEDSVGVVRWGFNIENVTLSGDSDFLAHRNESDMQSISLSFNYEDILFL